MGYFIDYVAIRRNYSWCLNELANISHGSIVKNRFTYSCVQNIVYMPVLYISLMMAIYVLTHIGVKLNASVTLPLIFDYCVFERKLMAEIIWLKRK